MYTHHSMHYIIGIIISTIIFNNNALAQTFSDTLIVENFKSTETIDKLTGDIITIAMDSVLHDNRYFVLDGGKIL